jgi:(1->4)-alpha-D-glucan 1-alpha-D-glucosylmutase
MTQPNAGSQPAAVTGAPSPHVAAPPRATYRLQFHAGFTFAQAAAAVPYLARLGVSHLYASPYLKACAGSTHGYDVIDHNQLNPEVGALDDFDALCDALAAHGLSHILDIVPNHVGVATNDNAWWNSVLENGPSSPYGRFFDINWNHPRQPGRVLLPLLGGRYATVLEKGELQLHFAPADAAFHLTYYQRRFPIEPASSADLLLDRMSEMRDLGEADLEEYERLVHGLAAIPPYTDTDPATIDRRQQETMAIRRRLAMLFTRIPALAAHVQASVRRINGLQGGALEPLDCLLSRQPYRLTYWRNAAHEINYRRFFDITDLAALAMERPEVFEHAHALVLRLLRRGRLTGLRVDHPDGLFDPAAYFHRLQEHRPGAELRETPPLYIVAEKILALDEALPDWPVSGTSGYDFLNHVNLLFVDPAAEAPLTDVYADFTGERRSFGDIAHGMKIRMLDTAFAGDLDSLTARLLDLAQQTRHGRDYSCHSLREALRHTIASFPVYRSYITSAAVSAADAAHVNAAIAAARAHCAADVLDFLQQVLLQHYPPELKDAQRAQWLRFAGRFQQLTAPVTAKGVEDTAFYNYHRLISLCEVGGDPACFGQQPQALHDYFAARQAKWPLAMSTLSTHDTKRSEDVRARLNVLSEMPSQWRHHALLWRTLNLAHRDSELDAPSPAEEYLLYQTLLGAWPMAGPAPTEEFTARIVTYMRKAMREAKDRTTWTDPNEPHEAAAEQFIRAILTPGSRFLTAFEPFAQRLIEWGMANSLAQTTLRLMAPGVPDTYQGAELWDLSLVDPDNRRPVDFSLRHRLLSDLVARQGDPSLLAELVQTRRDGRLKLYLTWRLLQLRQQLPGLFAHGSYEPCAIEGPHHRNLFAFLRRDAGDTVCVIVSRLLSEFMIDPFAAPDPWQNTTITIPPGHWLELLTTTDHPTSGQLSAQQALATLPVAVLRLNP